MATLASLCTTGVLISLEVELEDGEAASREIFAFPHVVDWIVQEMPLREPVLSDGLQALDEQLDFLLREYIRGADLSHWSRAHIMHPKVRGVYELKTPDLRLFGWFVKECCFVVGNIETKARLLQFRGMAGGYVENTLFRRGRLNLDEPKFTIGALRDLLCT